MNSINSCYNGLVNAQPSFIYINAPPKEIISNQKIPTFVFPQARIFGSSSLHYKDFFEPNEKRNIAIGRGDGFRPGRR